jgi:ABC-type dipeptide/oligopeptide/nickel transport system permease component
MPYEQRIAYLDEQREILYHSVGLDRPFLERCVEWWKKAILLDWGDIYYF